MRLLQQIPAYLAFAAFVVFFASHPEYRLLAADEAVVSLTFSHAGKRVGECRILSQEELNELPPNMRKPNECPRERHPVFVQVLANDRLLIERHLAPSGIWSDGKTNVYERITLESGSYAFQVRMNDSGSAGGFDFEKTADVSIVPGQNLVISFDGLRETFTFE
jgi:hypothetical protein